MKRLHSCLVVALLSSALAPANAAVVSAQEQGGADGAQLRTAEIELVMSAPTRASVVARFVIDAAGDTAVLVANLPGQRLVEVEFAVDGVPVQPRRERRSSALVAYVVSLSRGTHELSTRYAIRGDDASAFRFVLPVPDAVPSGAEPTVRLSAELPAGVDFAGNMFPALSPAEGDESGRRWASQMVAVPAVVHAVFGDAGLGLRMHSVLEWAGIAVALTLFAAVWLWDRRGRPSGGHEVTP